MQPQTEADATGLKNMQQLIQLRWIAVVGQVATILVVHFGFGIRLPLGPMLGALGFLAIFNLVSLWRWDRHEDVTDLELFVALLADVGTLTVQLYLSGGVTNPFIFLFLLQVCLGAVLLGPVYTRTLIGVTVACFVGLILFHRPLEIPTENGRGLASPYIQGLLLCFALDAALLAIFIARINRNLRARDARLADLRQRAAEEEHIVRMGLLASGAAHELGTPRWRAARPSSPASCCRPARRAARHPRRPPSSPSSTSWWPSGAPPARSRRWPIRRPSATMWPSCRIRP
jgi:two-component system sensor histidine kinase RegB